jgi:hypothetical protein
VKDKPYFDKLSEVLTSETAAKFMGFLMARDITGWNPRAIPETELRAEMKMRGIIAPTRFAIEIVNGDSGDGRLDPQGDVKLEATEIRMKRQDFYEAFLKWCDRRRIHYNENDTGFYLTMQSVLGVKLKNLRWGDDKKQSRGVDFTIGELKRKLETLPLPPGALAK